MIVALDVAVAAPMTYRWTILHCGPETGTQLVLFNTAPDHLQRSAQIFAAPNQDLGARAGKNRPIRRDRGWPGSRGLQGCDDRCSPRRLRLNRQGGRRGPQAHALSLGLQRRVLNYRDARAQRVAHAAGSLLNDVGQLVAEELLALGRLRVVLARGEVEVGAVCEGQGADRRSLMPDVNADVGEAGVEERLHLLLDRLRQGLAAAAGLEREIRRQSERISRLRLHGSRPRRLWQDRLRKLRSQRCGGLHGTGSDRAREDRSRGSTGPQRRLKRAGRGPAPHGRSRWRN